MAQQLRPAGEEVACLSSNQDMFRCWPKNWRVVCKRRSAASRKPLYGPNGSFSPAHVSYEMGLLRNDQIVSRFQFALALPESDEKNFIRRTNESRVSGTLF
jgi:hypothetical protein